MFTISNVLFRFETTSARQMRLRGHENRGQISDVLNPCKSYGKSPVPDMTYNVFGGALNLALSVYGKSGRKARVNFSCHS